MGLDPIQITYSDVQLFIERWVKNLSDKDTPIPVNENLSLSPRSILQHVQKKTPMGYMLVDDWRAKLRKRRS